MPRNDLVLFESKSNRHNRSVTEGPSSTALSSN